MSSRTTMAYAIPRPSATDTLIVGTVMVASFLVSLCLGLSFGYGRSLSLLSGSAASISMGVLALGLCVAGNSTQNRR